MNELVLAEEASGGVASRYRVRLARGEPDLRAAQLLRFMVFNLELQEGLDHSYHTCLDADRFDPVCDHILVEQVSTQTVVGTYRLQTGTRAKENLGYYSEQEFDFRPFEPFRGEILELGRACIHADHRTFGVLSLLWRGIAVYARQQGTRYMLGCSSLTSQDEAMGAAAYQRLQSRLAPPAWRTQPVPSFACRMDQVASAPPELPRLLQAYVSLGARICGPPAIDREFKTIDFLTLLDLDSLRESAVRRWLGSDAAGA